MVLETKINRFRSNRNLRHIMAKKWVKCELLHCATCLRGMTKMMSERKRHTAHRIASTRSAAVSPGGTLIQSQRGRGTLIQSTMGVPASSPDEGYPIQPLSGVPHPDLARVHPLSGSGWGYPRPPERDMRPGTRLPPRKDMGTPSGWKGPVDGSIMERRWGASPSPREQTDACENSTFPIPPECGRQIY